MATVICSVHGGRAKWPEHLRRNRYKCCAPCWAARMRLHRSKNVTHALVNGARGRAKAKGLPFNITAADITIPKRCPILGVLLHVRGGERMLQRHPYSPSLDRIDPEKGYVRGNVRVISHRANSLRLDASIEEIRKLYSFLQKEGRKNGRRRSKN